MEWREFIYFNRSDRSVVATIVVLVAALWLLVLALDDSAKLGKAISLSSQDSAAYAARVSGNPDKPQSPHYYNIGVQSVERFAFDPNTADSTQLLRLGLHPWQVRNIYKYRASGGFYAKPSDFAQLYGLTQKQYKELEPYIKISGDYRPAYEIMAEKFREQQSDVPRDSARYPYKINLNQRIAVNSADTTLLKRIPGIGSYYSRRIVEYRKRLGGFVDLAQLKEIEGFPEDALKYMCIPDEEAKTTKIKVNVLTLNQLKAHPYINFYQARAIIEYRRQRGYIKDIRYLAPLREFTAADIEKLSPYMEY